MRTGFCGMGLSVRAHVSCRAKQARQLQANRCAATFARALRRSIAAVLARGGANEEEPQTRAFGLEDIAMRDSIEALENTLQMGRWDADAFIGNTQYDPCIAFNC